MMKNLSLFILSISTVLFLTSCATTDNPHLLAAEAKATLGNVEPKIKKYVRQLYSEDVLERTWAVYNLGKLHKDSKDVIPYLIAMLGDTELAVMSRYISKDFTSGSTTTPADEAVKAIAKFGKAAVKPLLVSLKDVNQEVVLRAIKTLGLLTDSESIKPLTTFINHKNKRIRLEAANSLSHFKNPWVSEYLLASLKDKTPEVRSTALYALGKIKSPVTVPSLILLFKDKDAAIRSQVLYTLSNFRDERVIKPLLGQLNVKDERYHLEVISVLGNIRDYRVIKVLIELLKDKNKTVRIASADSLTQIADISLGISYTKWKRWWKNKLQRAQRN